MKLIKSEKLEGGRLIAVVAVIMIMGFAISITSCSSSDPQAPAASSKINEVTVVSSSTKRNWLDQVAERFNKEGHKTTDGKSVVVKVTHTTSGGSMNKILEGGSKPVVWSPGDGSWVEQINDAWQIRENKPIINQDCPSTVYVPIGFAMWQPMAEVLGWPDKPISWDTIVDLASDPQGWGRYGRPEWGKFAFGHTHPAYSNTGLLAMTTFVYGVSGKGGNLTAADVYAPAVEEAMRSLEKNTAKYGRSSSALFNLMVEQGPSYVHAIAASEETTLRFNLTKRDKLRFPLVFVFPKEGSIWADHPYCILDNAEWVNAVQVEGARLFRDYLLAQEQQTLAVNNRLRPVDAGIPLSGPFSLGNGTDPEMKVKNATILPSPNDEISTAVIDLFVQTKRKATVIVVLDTSGSMRGDKIESARTATAEFLERLHPGDEVTVLTFASQIDVLSPKKEVRDVVENLPPRILRIGASGGTALYDAVCEATKLADGFKMEDENEGIPRLYGIVLLSDGENTAGQTREADMFRDCLPANPEVDGFKIFPIAFGEGADSKLLTQIAKATGGRMFTAEPDSIGDVYFSISAEQ